MSRYMEDDLVGKLIAVNSFSLRSRPDFQVGDATQAQRNEWRRRPRILRQRRSPGRRGACARRPLGGRERRQSRGRIALRQRRGSTQCSTVSQDWFTIKKMGVSQGRLDQRAGVLGGGAGRRHRSGRRRPLLPEPRSDRPRAAHPEHSLHRRRRRRQARQRVRPCRSTSSSSRPSKSPLNRWVNPHGVIDAMIIQGRDERRHARSDGSGAGRDARPPPSAPRRSTTTSSSRRRTRRSSSGISSRAIS